MARCGVLAVALMWWVASVATADAQTSGRLIGSVTDTQAAVLAGALVTATSPALIGTQRVLTEVDGQYRFPSLPPGRYTLVFELDGFQTLRREDILLSLGQTLIVSVTMPLATLEESVIVMGDAPVLDVSSTAVGTEFSADLLMAVPSATDLWAALAQAPGVRMVGFDVGGSHKSQQITYESFGVRAQNRVVTDGVDTTEGPGGAGIYQDFFAHEEMSISAAGGDVTVMTPGSVISSTIKSGGNAFRSLTHLTYEDGGFVGDNIDEDTSTRGFTGNPNKLFWEGHADLGGPIARDKLWFYVAYNHFTIDKIVSGVDPAFSDLGVNDNVTAKGTWKASDRDTVIGYYQWGNKSKPRRGLSNTVGPDSILAQNSASWMYNGQWERMWSNRLFTDVKVGVFAFSWPMEPAGSFETSPPREDTATGVQTGTGWLSATAGGPFTFDRHKPQVTVTSSYFLPDKVGAHDFTWGFEWLDDQSRFGNNGSSGPILYRDRGGETDLIRVTDVGSFADFGTGWTGADDRNMRVSVFAQDRWSPNDRFSLSLGLRLDRQQPSYRDSVRTPVLSELFADTIVPGRTLLTVATLVPRIGISFVPTADRRSVVKGFYGRYYFNIADRLSAVNPGGTNTRDYRFHDLNGNRLYDGPEELGALVASAGGSSTTLDPDLKVPYADEFNVSFERQFWGEASFRAAYVRKMTHREFATFNVLREGQFTVPRLVTVIEEDFVKGVTRSFALTLYDIPDSLRGQVQNVVANVPDSAGRDGYTYDTIQLAFQKRLPGGVFVQSSFDYQWRDELRQNFATTSPLSSDPLGIDYFQNVHPDVPNRQQSTNWQGRLLGRYTFPRGVGVSLNLRAQSGWAYARLLRVGLPNAGPQTVFAEPIERNRSDTVTLVDARLDQAFTLGRGVRLTAIVDLFNVLNSNAVTNFNLLNGPQYDRIIATLDPRTLMLGVRIDF